MSNLTGGSIRILWDEDDSAEVTITGGVASFSVNGSTVTFPYTLSSSTTFTTTHSGTYTVSVEHHGYEIAGTPDGTREVVLRFGEQSVFAPTPDSGGAGGGLLSRLHDLYAAKADANSFTEAQTITPPATAAHGVRVTSPDFADSSKAGIYLVDTAGNAGKLAQLDHYGDTGGSSYALDIRNYPGALSAVAVHQYSGADAAVQLDNCADEPIILMRNTQNTTNAPGTQGTGHYLDLFGDLGTVGTPNVQRFGVLSKDLEFYAYQATKPWTWKTNAGVVTPAARFLQTEKHYGVEIVRSGTTSGYETHAAARVSNASTGPGLQLDQTGAAKALQIVQSGAASAININVQAGAAGLYSFVIDGQDYGPHFRTTTNSGDALTITKNATGGGRAVVVNNKGTGVSVEIQENGTTAFTFTAAGLPRWARAAAVQTTVGAAGAASALPATPSKYLKVVGDDGTTYVVPAYAAS